MTVRFEEAWKSCFEVLRKFRQSALPGVEKVVLIRDLVGRIHLALDRVPAEATLQPLLAELATAGGSFWSGQLLDGEKMLAPAAVFDSADAFHYEHGIWGLERLVTGADWGRAPLENRSPRPPRATLYGLKGGVGRSTALCVWARHLAQLGHRVLVVDLDLESPGVSSLLLPAERVPDFGVVDWFVEDAVGNNDDDLLRGMISESPLAPDAKGRIFVVPAGGSKGQDYLPKLSRVYLDSVGAKPRTFGQRLAELVDLLEAHVEPTVVLLDSRAGLHDVAAVAITRLDAMTFLFATTSRQTWDGYLILLRNWSQRPRVATDVRQRIRVVASQIPETGREQYIEQLTQSSYDAFSEMLYEEADPKELDVFNFDVDASDAPHHPLHIYWSRSFQDWDPMSSEVTNEQVQASFADFLERATELVLPATPPEDGEDA